MTPDDNSDVLEIIHLNDEQPDDAARQLTAYRNKMRMLLLSWRRGFATEAAGRDYPLEDGELLQLRSSNPTQLLAEHWLEDKTRLRFDYDEARANDKLIVSAYEASGEVITIEGSLADLYDQLAGLLFTSAAIDGPGYV